MQDSLLVSSDSLINKILSDPYRHRCHHVRFLTDMCDGILGSASVLLSNISRFLSENRPLIHTENRLSQGLGQSTLPWDETQLRLLELQARQVSQDDIVAFDPGDLAKEYAEKMEGLYPVHDGSKDRCILGYEIFSVEALKWVNTKEKHHIPLYQHITSARRPDYVSQNKQIIDAVQLVTDYLDGRGIFAFDRGHDRSRIFENVFLKIPNLRWILRLKENRTIIPLECNLLPHGESKIGILDLARLLPLTEQGWRLEFPQRTAPIHLGWTRVALPFDPKRTPCSLVVVHDRRNVEPVYILTSLPVNSPSDALLVFGRYLCRWAQEEGYRFEKSFLNLENIRTEKFVSTQRLAFLVFLVYVFVTLFYRSNPKKIEEIIETRLKNFVNTGEINYKYYRVAKVMRLLMCEQQGKDIACLLKTEVG